MTRSPRAPAGKTQFFSGLGGPKRLDPTILLLCHGGKPVGELLVAQAQNGYR